MNKLYLALSLLVAAPVVFASEEAKQEEAPKAPVTWTEAQANLSKSQADKAAAFDAINTASTAVATAAKAAKEANKALAAKPEDAELKAKVEVANNALKAASEEYAKVNAAYAGYTGIFKKAADKAVLLAALNPKTAAAIVAVSAIVAYEKVCSYFSADEEDFVA